MTEGITYNQFRETILSYENAAKSWTTEAVLKSLNPIAELASSSYSGPPPNRVWVDKGGKQKGKGKSKTKGRNWWDFGSYALRGAGRGRGKGRSNNFKGKGKQKGKSKGKAKDGGKNGDRKGKQVDPQQCRFAMSMGIGHEIAPTE